MFLLTTNDDSMSDQQIVTLYWDRNETAISETDKKHGRTLQRISYNILRDNSDSEECKNDTYLSLWNNIPPTRPVSLRAFAAIIIRRLSINRYYRKKRKREVPSELTVSMEECKDFISSLKMPEDEAAGRELGERINAFLTNISAKERYIFLGRFWFCDSVRKIARELKLSESAVYKELEKLKKRLKEYLAE